MNTNPDVEETKAALEEPVSKVAALAGWTEMLQEPAVRAIYEIECVLSGPKGAERMLQFARTCFLRGFLHGGKWTVGEMVRMREELKK